MELYEEKLGDYDLKWAGEHYIGTGDDALEDMTGMFYRAFV